MLSDLPPLQKELANYMSALSERAYGAAWMEGLEFALWSAVSRGPFMYGQLQLKPEHIQYLSDLSNRCGGWVFFHEQQEESFASFEEWARMVSLVERSK